MATTSPTPVPGSKALISQQIKQRFVGRTDALKVFYQRFAYRAMMNCIYYRGGGGLGKTWILKKIILDFKDDTDHEVLEIIDFFDTRNHSKRGLQFSLKERLGRPEIFAEYDQLVARLDEAIDQKDKLHSSVVISLEKRADQVFIECCQKAVLGRGLVMLFDTFERVQFQEAGKWMIEDFLPNVKMPVIAIAGRPTSPRVKMPDNVMTYDLKGLNLEETRQYVHKLREQISEEDIQTIFDHTGGFPLMIDLITNLPSPRREHLIADMATLPAGQMVQNSRLKCELVSRYGQPKDKLNHLILVMAYFKRRFDLDMLAYVIGNLPRHFAPDDFPSLFETLQGQVCVKEYPQQESHLLHDEVQRLVDECILKCGNVIWDRIKPDVHKLIVDKYYPEKLAPPANPQLRRQLAAEQLGYLLDEDAEKGVERYLQLRGQNENDFDFEALLWGEVRAFQHLDGYKDRGLQIYQERGRWLQNNSRYRQGEDHFREMLDRFPDEKVTVSQSLGFMLMRRGKIDEAKNVFAESRKLVEPNSKTLAFIDLNLGQAARMEGKWKDALDHYARSYCSASKQKMELEMASVNINRSYLYSLQGMYTLAREQCDSAIALLDMLPENDDTLQRKTYAWMNLGTIRRHTNLFDMAHTCYLRSQEYANKRKDREGLCNVLQHLGINQHLQGRWLRRNDKSGIDLAKACQHQQQAWNYLIEALQIARESDWEQAIAEGLNRLAKVYREIYHMSGLTPIDPRTQQVLKTLMDKANSYAMVFEIKYEYELIFSGPFESLDWREKACRLFDVSALVAEEVNDFRRALDSLTELTRILLWLKKYEQADLTIKRIEHLKGYDYQEPLFAAMLDILRGTMALDHKQYDDALEKYKQAYSQLAKESGFATYHLIDRLRDLEWRIREDLPAELRIAWCDALEDQWIADGLSSARPEMIDSIEKLRSAFIV